MNRSRSALARPPVIALILVLPALSGCQNASQEMPITTKSKEALALFVEARTKGENWHLEEAHHLYVEAVAKDPDFAMARAYVAESSADPKVLQEELKKALALAPRVSKGEQLFLAADEAWFLENDHEKGTELFRQIAEMYPKDKRAVTWLGECYLESDLENAVTKFHEAIALDKGFVKPRYFLAYAYMLKGDFGRAEEQFKIYLRLAPAEPNPHDCLGDLYMKMGRFDDAISQYEQAVKLDPHFALSQSKIGSSYVLKGQYEEGRKALERAKTMEPNPATKVSYEEGLVRSYVYAGDYKNALEASDVAIRMAREFGLPGEAASLHLAKGMICCELKNYAAAVSSFAECRKSLEDPALPAIARQGTEAGEMFWEVLVAAEQKDSAGAEAKLADMKTAAAKLKEPLFSKYTEGAVAFMLLAKGDYAGADQQFAKANVDEPFFTYYAAVSKEQAGDAAGARKLYAKVADWNEDTLWYAFVRSKAKARLP